MQATESLYSPTARAERLIALGRVILAGSSLLALWLDPVEPVKHARIAYGLLAAYLLYALVVALVVLATSVAQRPPWRLGSHAFDLAFFTAFVYFTAGPSSPFFAFFVFSLICAALRWQWRGALWTAAVALVALVLLGFYFGQVLHNPEYELHTFIIRAFYLAVIALLVGYLGAHEARTRREISALAGFAGGSIESRDTLVEELLSYALGVLDAPRAVLGWNAEGEGLRVVECRRERDGGPSFGRVPELEGGSLVDDALVDEDFLCPDLGPPPWATLLGPGGAEPRRWRGEPLTALARSTLVAGSVLSLRLSGQRVSGRLSFLDKPGMTGDDLLLGSVVRRTMTTALDRFYLHERVKESVADEERVRLARDLHDGVLQSMTGIGLRLAAARGQLATAPEAAGETLDRLQELIALEQRDLRFFIRELHVEGSSEPSSDSLATRLAGLADRIESVWALPVDLEIEPTLADLPGRLGREVYHLVREGLVNAARHADASRVTVHLARGTSERLEITVDDDGHGFPYHGKFEGEELARERRGPRSLRDRIAALGGHLTLESRSTGSCLQIVLPSSL